MSSNTDEIVKLAKEKSIQARNSVVEAIKKLQQEDKNITFSSVAKAAKVSRSYLYNNEELRPLIEELRETNNFGGLEVDAKDKIIEKQKDEIKRLREQLSKYKEL